MFVFAHINVTITYINISIFQVSQHHALAPDDFDISAKTGELTLNSPDQDNNWQSSESLVHAAPILQNGRLANQQVHLQGFYPET